MKHFAFSAIFLLTTIFVNGQSFSEKIARKTCDRLSTFDDYNQIKDSIQACISKALVEVSSENPQDENKGELTVEGIKNIFSEVYKNLPSNCYKLRSFKVDDKEKKFYKMSDVEAANDHFEKGNKFMDVGDYKKSIKEFKAAIKLDANFVYAIDHLAISYRRQSNYKQAVKYYMVSLNIFPEGSLALQNLAGTYSFMKEYDKSLNYYNCLKFYYPYNPEGYFGAAKIFFIKADYENALDDLLMAHQIYAETKSDYIDDSKQLLTLMYAKLKSINKLDLFERKVKEHNVVLGKM